MASEAERGGREFVLDTVIVAVTQILLKLRGFITLPLIVKLLGTASYGVFSQVIAFSGLAGALFAWNLQLPLVRFMVADRARWGSIYATLMLATVASVAVGAALVGLFARPLGAVLIGGTDGATYLLLGMGLVVVANVRQINMNVYRATGRFVARGAIELATTFGELLGIWLIIRQGRGLAAALLFAVIWEAVAALATTAHAATVTGWGRLDGDILRRALAYALPLIPASLATWILDRADRFVVNGYLGSHGVGVYSATYTLASFLLLFQAPFQLTLFPKVGALWDVDRARAERYISMANQAFLTLGIPFVVGTSVLAPAIFVRLGNAEIAAASQHITFVLEAGVLLWGVSSTYMHALYGAHRTGVIGVTTIVAAALNVVLNFVLVPPLGVMGAAIATLIAYAAVLGTMFAVVRRLARVDLYPAYLVRCAIAAAVMGVGIHWLRPATNLGLFASAGGGAAVYFVVLGVLGGFPKAYVAGIKEMFRRR
jgi:O-antigen/teichoic acid export membrane protein